MNLINCNELYLWILYHANCTEKYRYLESYQRDIATITSNKESKKVAERYFGYVGFITGRIGKFKTEVKRNENSSEGRKFHRTVRRIAKSLRRKTNTSINYDSKSVS